MSTVRRTPIARQRTSPGSLWWWPGWGSPPSSSSSLPRSRRRTRTGWSASPRTRASSSRRRTRVQPPADYTIPGIDDPGVTTILAGLIGLFLVFGLMWGLGQLLARRRRGLGAPPGPRPLHPPRQPDPSRGRPPEVPAGHRRDPYHRPAADRGVLARCRLDRALVACSAAPAWAVPARAGRLDRAAVRAHRAAAAVHAPRAIRS